MDHLDEANAGQCLAQRAIGPVVESVNDLQGIRAAAPLLRDDRLGLQQARQQERRDPRRHAGRDRGNLRFGDDAGAAGHRRDEPDRRGAGAHSELSLCDGGDATDLDARSMRWVHPPTNLLPTMPPASFFLHAGRGEGGHEEEPSLPRRAGPAALLDGLQQRRVGGRALQHPQQLGGRLLQWHIG